MPTYGGDCNLLAPRTRSRRLSADGGGTSCPPGRGSGHGVLARSDQVAQLTGDEVQRFLQLAGAESWRATIAVTGTQVRRSSPVVHRLGSHRRGPSTEQITRRAQTRSPSPTPAGWSLNSSGSGTCGTRSRRLRVLEDGLRPPRVDARLQVTSSRVRASWPGGFSSTARRAPPDRVVEGRDRLGRPQERVSRSASWRTRDASVTDSE